jgi:hypothetical protein
MTYNYYYVIARIWKILLETIHTSGAVGQGHAMNHFLC